MLNVMFLLDYLGQPQSPDPLLRPKGDRQLCGMKSGEGLFGVKGKCNWEKMNWNKY